MSTLPPDATPPHANDGEGPRPGGPRRVLVTGGSGFIGSHLVGLLLDRGDAVTVIDNLTTGRRHNLPDRHERLRFFEADLSDALHALGKGETFDQIYHLAAAVGVKLVVEDPITAIETNIARTIDLLRFARSRAPGGVPTPTLVVSSSEVYGKGAKTPFAEDDDVVYGPTTMSRWCYGCSKAVDEYLALAHAARGLPAVVVRLFNTVGPRQVGEFGMVLPRFVAAALRGEPLEVFGDGRQTRCFCDVRDVVAAMPRVLGEPSCRGKVFNLGSDRAITIADLAALVVRVLGSRSTIAYVPYERAYAPGFEDLRDRRPDLTRIRSAIGFEPTVPLEQTIRDLAAEIARAPGAQAGVRG
ncbi:MAG: GDP-mannose 4,6-dehydratase [Phycisphaeraceae bacterium]|nr:MAG: GDP-mannose 4,6-dehydratase [Phycisphaeraceae bacterium]